MAQRHILKKRFTNRVRNVAAYLTAEWSLDVSNDFLDKVEEKISAICRNPTIGVKSETYKNLHSISVTGHNRMFYRIEAGIIVFVMMSDTRHKRYKR